MYFRLLAPAVKETISQPSARLGRLLLNNVSIDTPSFIAPASRGTIPHLSQDNLQDHTNIKGIYIALEDCNPPPLSILPLISSIHHLLTPFVSRREIPSRCPNLQPPRHPPYLYLNPLHLPSSPLRPACSARYNRSLKYRPFSSYTNLRRLPHAKNR